MRILYHQNFHAGNKAVPLESVRVSRRIVKGPRPRKLEFQLKLASTAIDVPATSLSILALIQLRRCLTYASPMLDIQDVGQPSAEEPRYDAARFAGPITWEIPDVPHLWP